MKTFLLEAGARVRDFFVRLWAAIRRRPAWILVLVPAFALVYVLGHIPFTPSIGDIKKARSEQPTIVLSADGKELATFKRLNREWIKLGEISPNVVAALLATEDHRFYDHGGLDVRRTLSAAVRTLKGDVQGGSTLTQQLARNLFPEEIGRSQTITRKVKEAITALKLEALYSKNEILEIYLNTVPFLYNAYGIEMAAQTYFDKSARRLDVLESATLIGMLKGTSYYNPVHNPQRAVGRRNIVLAQLVKHQKLQAAEYEALKARPLGLDFERKDEDLGAAPHLTQQLRRWLIAWADRKGYNIHADGLVVHTTIDSRLQKQATDAVTRQADRLQVQADATWGRKAAAHKPMLHTFLRESTQYRAAREEGLSDAEALKRVEADTEFVQQLWRDKTWLTAAFLAMEPSNGHIRAWVGSRDFKRDQFDHVQQARRQPGSTFKPFVYGAAFDQGVHPSETLVDQPVEIRIDAKQVWKPGDVGQPTYQPMTLRDGLIQSKNTITAQLVQRIGAARVAKVAWDLGVRESKLDAVPSLALGTSPVTLKEMVTAYGTIANSGAYVEPVLVTRIEDRERNVVESFAAKPPEQGMSTSAAQTLLDVMRGVVDRGTGAGIRSRFGIAGDLAGKTGTTQDNTDGWFILMHPNLVSGAWVGFNDNRITMGDSWGQGSQNALHVVGDFFQQASKAKIVDTNAKFAAPKDAGMLDRVNDWWNSVFQSPPVDPQPVIVADPLPEVTVPQVSRVPEPPIATLPTPPTPPMPVETSPSTSSRAPDSSWTIQRPRAYPEYRLPEPPVASSPPTYSPPTYSAPSTGSSPPVMSSAPSYTPPPPRPYTPPATASGPFYPTPSHPPAGEREERRDTSELGASREYRPPEPRESRPEPREYRPEPREYRPPISAPGLTPVVPRSRSSSADDSD